MIPQNCPHGRPTIRHLVNLALIKNNGENDENTEKFPHNTDDDIFE